MAANARRRLEGAEPPLTTRTTVARKGRTTVSPQARGQSERRVNAKPSADEDGRSRRLASVMVIGSFVLVFSLLCVSSLLQKSATIDEPVHLLSGYSYLKWADFRPNPEHPPFAKIWAALPLLAFDLKDPRISRPHWDLILENEFGYATTNVAEDMFFVDNDGEVLLFCAKLQMILLGILLGIFVFLWTRELFGVPAAVVSLFLFTFDPNILAHSQIVHTDIAFATWSFIATYFFWRALRQLTWANLVGAAVFFGLASITKYSYPALVLVWAVLGAGTVIASGPLRWGLGSARAVTSRWQKTMVILGILATAGIVAYGFTWTAYGFRYNAIPGGARALTMAHVMPPDNPALQALVTFVTSHHLAPEAWIYGQLYTLKYLTRPAYLLGEISRDGFLAYFPVAILVKTPLPALILLAWSVALWSLRRIRGPGPFLLLPVCVYVLLAISSRMNIGLRHILPIYPFLFVLLGGGAAHLWRGGGVWTKRGLALLGVWQLWSSMAVYPHYLSYFNEVAGGAENGHRVLLDSNLDWGQDLKGLKRWMDANGVKKIEMLYFGYVDPEYYGIAAVYPSGNRWLKYDPPATRSPDAPRYAAISANILYGSRLFLDPNDADRGRSEDFVRDLQSKRPVAIIGHSIYVFRLD